MHDAIAFLQAHETISALVAWWFFSGAVGAMPAPTAPISYITLYNYSPTGASDSICNTTILSYPIAS